jgi:hypothetical protein
VTLASSARGGAPGQAAAFYAVLRKARASRQGSCVRHLTCSPCKAEHEGVRAPGGRRRAQGRAHPLLTTRLHLPKSRSCVFSCVFSRLHIVTTPSAIRREVEMERCRPPRRKGVILLQPSRSPLALSCLGARPTRAGARARGKKPGDAARAKGSGLPVDKSRSEESVHFRRNATQQWPSRAIRREWRR